MTFLFSSSPLRTSTSSQFPVSPRGEKRGGAIRVVLYVRTYVHSTGIAVDMMDIWDYRTRLWVWNPRWVPKKKQGTLSTRKVKKAGGVPKVEI